MKKKIIVLIIVLAAIGLGVGAFLFFRPRKGGVLLGERQFVYITSHQHTRKSGGYTKEEEYRDTDEEGRAKCEAVKTFLAESTLARTLSYEKSISPDNLTISCINGEDFSFVMLYLESGLVQIDRRFYEIKDWNEEAFLKLLDLSIIR